MTQPRIISFDIEATGLKADFAFLLSAAFADVNTRETKVIALDDFKGSNVFANEGRLTAAVIDEMNKADMLVTYFGTRYDKPFMNSKALEYGLAFPAPIPHVDLFYTVKSNLSLSRKSLQNVGYFAQLTTEKTPVEGRLWKAAQAGDLRALKMIKDHNAADVLILAEAYDRLRSLIRQHPRLREGTEQCRACGSNHLERRGYQYTSNGVKKARIQCKECHTWGYLDGETIDVSDSGVRQETAAPVLPLALTRGA